MNTDTGPFLTIPFLNILIFQTNKVCLPRVLIFHFLMKQDFLNYQYIHYSHHADTFVYTTYLCMPVYIFVMQNMENLQFTPNWYFLYSCIPFLLQFNSSHLLLYPFWYLWLSALHYAVDLTKKFCIQKLVYTIAPNECNSYYTAKWYLRNLWTREVTENGLFWNHILGL